LHSLERPHDVGAADTGKREDDDGWRAWFFDVFRQGREFCVGGSVVRRGGSGEDWSGGHVRVWMNVGKLARSRESVKAEVDRTAEPKGFPRRSA
jgi:hypothetical protein